jgi:CRISPR-associated protein Cas2
MSGRRLYIVSYDIRCPKRWRRVFKYLKRCGTHRQLSVFLVRMEPARARRLAEKLSEFIDANEDSVMLGAIDTASAEPMAELGVAQPDIGARLVIM